jgi:hypothetical protein
MIRAEKRVGEAGPEAVDRTDPGMGESGGRRQEREDRKHKTLSEHWDFLHR